MRKAAVRRTTRETNITLEVVLDGTGQADVNTGVGFFDHMLEAWAVHSMTDLTIKAEGDLYVEAHHTVEDCGIVLGQAIRQALGERTGICRFGEALLPMDDALARAVLDISGRPYLAWRASIPPRQLGNFHTELAEEFWRALAQHAGLTLHIDVLAGTNSHHMLEAIWKACALAMRRAWSLDPQRKGTPSSKGMLQ